jgi:thiamine biosynthesis lipoprotein
VSLPLLRTRIDVLGTTGYVLASDEAGLAVATDAALHEVELIDRACSRFRPDSDLSRVNDAGGRPTSVSPSLVDALEIAVRAALVTDGDVDPTIGRALRVVGYDRDFGSVPADGPPVLTVAVARRWPEIVIDRSAQTVRVPPGVALDLGATAKALAADRAAAAAASAAACGVLVSLGGDIALGGPSSRDGWPVMLDDRHDAPISHRGPTVVLRNGGLATSGTMARRWRRGGVDLHHLIDPRTGRPADEVWRTATVAAACCVDANIASTAAIIRGFRAVAWLEESGLAARLVALDGSEVLVGSWGETCATTVGSSTS